MTGVPIEGVRALVTGGAGTIGSHVVDELIRGGAVEVVVLDNFVRGRRENLAWAIANVLIKRLGPINVFILNAWVALLACPQLLLASLLFESGQASAIATADWRAWSSIVYMAVLSTIAAYGLWYYLIEKHDLNRVVPMTLLSPVLAVALAIPMLGEQLTKGVFLGGMLTIAGVAMIQFLPPGRPKSPPPS